MTPAQREIEERNLRSIEVTKLPEDRLFTSVYTASDYCYAHCAETNELYSWGDGYNGVLGLRRHENCYSPTLVDPTMFSDCKIR